MRALFPLTSLSCVVVLAVCPLRAQESETAEKPAQSQDPAPEHKTKSSDFCRFVEVGDDEGRYETAITSYRNDDGVEVSLIAAVHIADAGHYAQLQRLFTKYDALLYELVAKDSDRPRPGRHRHSNSPVSLLQSLLKRGLELEFQLDAIDYTPKNFVHADLTPAGFMARMEERGENFATLFLSMMQQEMANEKKRREERLENEDESGKPPGDKSFDLVSAFRRGEGRHMMRMMFAKQLGRIEQMASGVGSGKGTTLLEGRNERALEVLRQQIKAGKKKLGIYYGAAHMPGIERALYELGFHKTGQRWLVAWDISKRKDPGLGEPAKQGERGK